jgi:predicted nucleic acid-binding protein
MDREDVWIASRLTYVESIRALSRATGPQSPAVEELRLDWPSLEVVELSEAVAERASGLAVREGLRSLDAVHLASAFEVLAAGLIFATFDGRLHASARRQGMQTLPDSL